MLCVWMSSVSAFDLDFLKRIFSFDKGQNEVAVIEWAQKNLPKTGILKENEEGYVYLKVDIGYIDQLFPLLKNPHYVKPPFFRRPDSPGAHISVFYVEETRHIKKIKEIGQKFAFQIASLSAVPPKSREYIVLNVKSPELEKLRKKYGLSPFLKGHEFHITIAKKKNRIY